MEPRIPGFPGEYLQEFDIARSQLLALAEFAPEELYRWSPAGDTRTFAAVLVHIAAVNLALLRSLGIRRTGELDLYGELQGDQKAQLAAMVRRNHSLERTAVGKQEVAELLRGSLEAARRYFIVYGAQGLETVNRVFGDGTTARRLFLRMLAHSHEHMGQAVAYVRAFGLKAPWPDPLDEYLETPDRKAAGSASAAR